MAYYWEHQPAELQQKGQVAYLQGIGADPLLRGSHVLFKTKRNRCEERVVQKGNERLTYYETPVGSIQMSRVYSHAGNTWFLMKHPVQGIEDFKVLTCKYLIHHTCGHLKALIPLMAKTEIDMIESISPPPTGNIELWEAKAALPFHIGLIGGIEPTVFLNSTMEELQVYVISLMEKMGNKRYILANSDSCPPGVTEEKYTW